MTLPSRSLTVKSGGNGVAQGGDNVHALIGTCTLGTVGVGYTFTDPGQIAAVLGYGNLADAASYELENGAGSIICYRALDSVAGVITTATPYVSTGDTGTCVASGAPNNRYMVTVEITTTGTLGTAAFKYALDDGPDEDTVNWSLPVQVPGGGTYTIPNTGIILTFAAGAGPTFFTAGNKFHFNTTAPAFQSADLTTAMDALALGGSYWRYLHIVGEITAGLAATIDTKMESFATSHKYRRCYCEAADMDPISAVTKGGTAPPDVTVSGIPYSSWNVKIKTTLIGALGVAKFQYSLDGGNTYNGTDILVTAVTGINPIGVLGLTFTFGGAIGNIDNTWTFNTWDKNDAVWMAALIAAYAAFASAKGRVIVGAGFMEVGLPSGASVRRPIMWGASALRSKIGIEVDLGQIEDAGPIAGCASLSHDEDKVPGLDTARFMTARTWEGIAGYYFTQGCTMAAGGSDFDLDQYGLVMDAGCEAVDATLALLCNKHIRVYNDPANPLNGCIDERDALGFDRKILTALEDATVNLGRASDCTVRVHRNDNVLSTRQILVDFEIVGLGYVKTWTGTIGYKNPKISG
ncbi:MAG: DUF2586 family protein [bacterium]